MKVVIIEDEELAARRLEGMIMDCDSSVEVIARLESVEDSVEWFRNHPCPDLIFLDIHLEDDLSFAIFEKVKVDAPVIFTTAYDEYAIRAFKLRSIDYLLKPIVQEELARSLDKFREFSRPNSQPDIESLFRMFTGGGEENYKERFSITVGQKIKSYSIAEISWFYSEAGITFMVVNDNHQYPVDFSLDELTTMLNPKEFFRINRQFLVKINSVRNIHIYPKGRLKLELLPASAKEIFVSRDKVTKFKEWLG
ncbi:LytTR family DNA-binding domain-containing protein [Lentimicrobium sp.]|jgi:DNA-binding LytR/AlgR family response regulator|uniref:LytR/AlgR family response regulator transcription factor n=1 Tax=Lentimicrobium sp. TaxID=2034841 RepID=UPI002D15119F|nr:LytTR family DNA-binding domain-containing protein [Lentimicrobium sp.]HPR25350.1 LytTR family DNA-binding domain-containing protein [Lentimicrobium sp.]